MIEASDKASVQLNVAEIDPETGIYTGNTKTYAIAGYVRDHSESDTAIWHMMSKNTRAASAAP